MKKIYLKCMAGLMMSLLTVTTPACQQIEDVSSFEISSSTIDLSKTDPVQLGADEKTYTIDIKASQNVSWTASVNKGTSFVKITPTGKQQGGGQITITIAKNTITEARSASVEIQNSFTQVKKTVEFLQKAAGQPLIQITPSREFANLKADADTVKFEIAITPADMKYTLRASDSWITEAMPKATKGYSYAVDQNTGTQERTGYIYMLNELSKGMDTIVVKQKGVTAQTVRFAVLSDTHFGSTDPEVRVGRSLETIVNQTPKVDAIFIVGDLTDYGRDAQYTTLMATVKSIVPADIKVFYMMGNHDRYGDSDGTLYTKHTGQPFNQYAEIKGMPFITVSVNSTSNSGSSCYSDDTRGFVSSNMATAKTKFPGKPIFVFGHVPTANSGIWGSTPGPDNWSSDKLESTLKQYPQAFFFSGHTHFPLRDERSIWQKDYTAINDGGNDYGELINGLADGVHPAGSQQVQEVLIVDVDESLNVTMRKIDTNRGEEIKTPWVMEAPHDGSKFKYTDNRVKPTAATFASGAKVTVADVSISGCKVTFPQATNDDVVYSYEISLMDANATALKSVKIFSQYWLGSAMPTNLSWNMSGLQPNTKYSISVKAEDSFGLLSSGAIVSDEFTTSVYTPNPSTTAPKADMMDVAFTKDGAADISVTALPVTAPQTKPTTKFNADLNMWVATFPKSNSTYFMANYANSNAFMNGIKGSFTYEVYIRTAESVDMCPVSAQESGGWGIEQDVSGGTVYQTWAYIGTGYKNVSFGSPTTSADYYHLVYTYDGTKVVTYMNGMKVEELACTGELKFPETDPADNARWIAIGGDATWTSRATAQYSFKGDIAVARMHSKAASRDEVYRLYEQLLDRKATSNFADLNTALTVTIPAMSDETKKAALLQEGWALMGNIATTEAQVNTFLGKL